ncbi:TonB-dependent receptor [Sulfurivirga sp.]|uniref:TonB-dependent receptor domain-containing protein n=1 Tax=Sulfurivirga sp. TaxID=2614236 RepID=UPI0025DDB692|nr:TonB-dependent receptor [Sulfurivirga sp.]
MRPTLIALAVMAALPAQAATLSPVEVSDAATLEQESLQPDMLTRTARGDTGDRLRQINGVDGSRMGGHGIDPVIRGQKEARVRVVLDGAEIAPGCPNRMDPATVYGDVESFDEITVRFGTPTLTEPVDNASGGTLALRRRLPVKSGVHGRVSAEKSSLIDYGLSADLSAAGEKAAVRVFGNRTEAQNYEDGNGDTVKARYSHLGYGALAGFQLAGGTLRLSAERSRTEDALYPGAKMDSPYTEGNIVRLGYNRPLQSTLAQQVDAGLYRSTVDHLMDNYSLRPNSGMKLRTPTDTETVGGHVKLTSQLGTTRLTWGWDARYENKSATLENGMTGAALSYMWPDTRIERNSLFAEAAHAALGGTLTLGARMDHIDSDARKADMAAAGGTPRSLYDATYSTPAKIRHSDTLWNLLGRWHRPLGSGRIELGLARTQRAPDATERYMAKSAGANSWVGNPNLKAETHTQLDIALAGPGLRGWWQLRAWADWVSDYILKDQAQNQPAAVKVADTRIIYVNRDAELRGVDLTVSWALPARTLLSASASYTYGYNTADHRNLAGIPPLNGFVTLAQRHGTLRYGARWNWAVDKSDIDPLSPDEVGRTPGWNTLDLFADWRVRRNLTVSAGVDNVFDHAYADYLNRRTDPTQGTSWQVNEPGRSFYAKITATF